MIYFSNNNCWYPWTLSIRQSLVWIQHHQYDTCWRLASKFSIRKTWVRSLRLYPHMKVYGYIMVDLLFVRQESIFEAMKFNFCNVAQGKKNGWLYSGRDMMSIVSNHFCCGSSAWTACTLEPFMPGWAIQGKPFWCSALITTGGQMNLVQTLWNGSWIKKKKKYRTKRWALKLKLLTSIKILGRKECEGTCWCTNTTSGFKLRTLMIESTL